MAEIIVTSTADSGSGSLRQALADAADGDVILFDPVIFPAGQTTTIYLSSYLLVNKNIGIYCGAADGNGGYTSGATITRYVVRDVDGVETEVVVDDEHPALENEVVLMHVTTRVALDGQATQDPNAEGDWDGWTGVRCLSYGTGANDVVLSGITCQNGLTVTSLYGGTLTILNQGSGQKSFLIKDCAFINGIRPQGGSGGVCVSVAENNVVRFSRCEFAEFKSYTTGGFYAYTGNIEVVDSVFRDCYSGSNGACLYAGTNCTLTSCVFADSECYSGAGAYIGTARHVFDSCVFWRLTSSGTGGAASNLSNGEVSFNGCSFKECSSASGGALYLSDESKNVITDCAFKDCTSTGNGAGIRSEAKSINEINNCVFENCAATNYGGAATSNGNSRNTFNGCSFYSCNARSGSVSYISANTVNEFNSCDFVSCSAQSDGGAFTTRGSSLNRFLGCNFESCASNGRGGGLIAIAASHNYFDDKCVFRDCTAKSSGSGVFDMSLPICDVGSVSFINCGYEAQYPKELRRTRYFTNTNDSGDGSLRSVINAANSCDTIEPDPIVFPNGSVVTIPLTSALSITKNLYILGKGRRIVLDGQNATRIISIAEPCHALIAEDVDIVKGNDTSSNGSALYTLGGQGVIFTRSRFCGNHGQCFLYMSGNGGVRFVASLFAGNFTTSITDRNASYFFFGSTVAGNYLNGEAATFRLAYTKNVNSIVDTTYSTVGFTTPPPDTLAAENWNADLWKSWDLTLRDDSTYKSGAAALDEIDALVVGDGAKCDIEGCPRKPNGSFGAYEDRTGIQLVTTTADSGEGSLRSAIAAAQDGDVVLFSYVTFPKDDTTVIPLSARLYVAQGVACYGGESDGEGGYTSGAAVRRYVYRDVDNVTTKVVVDENNPSLDGETVLFEIVPRVALDGQGTVYHAGISADAGGCVFSGIGFYNGTNNNGGSITISNDANNAFIDCAFDSCTSPGYGGALYFYQSSHNTLTTCSFVNCSTRQGGAIYMRAESQNTLNGCCFDSCSADSYGGAITAAVDAQNLFNNCIIYNCVAGSHGGGLFATNRVQNELNNCTITKCSATTYGAGVYANNYSQFEINDSNINNCTATTGAVGVCIDHAVLTLNACIIADCTTSSAGGVVQATVAGHVTLTDCEISNCSSASGGCLYASGESQIDLAFCNISDCSATNGGGLYVLNNVKIECENCNIVNCSASNVGGFLYTGDKSTLVCNDCEFSGCSAKNGGFGNCLASSSIDFTDCSFSNCSAVDGGGGGFLLYAASVGAFTRCAFDGCTATSSAGAIYSYGLSKIILTDTTITNCSASSGGGCALYSAPQLIAYGQNVIRDCTSTYGGSGITDMSLLNSDVSQIAFENCVYYKNDNPSAVQTRYFTTTADSGDGSLRAVIAASISGDTIEPDPNVFPKGATITIKLSSRLLLNRRLYIRGAGRRIILDGQGETCIASITDSTYATYFEDVDFINAYSAVTTDAPVHMTGNSGAIYVRSRIVGGDCGRIFYSTSSGGVLFVDSLVTGNKTLGDNIRQNAVITCVGSTVAGNYSVGGVNLKSTYERNIGSIVQPTPTEAGFRVAPPDSIAAEDWNADLWKQWDLSIAPESPYATTTADDWDGADLWSDGGDWRYDTLGLPRKANGAAGAYENYDFDYYQGDTATSFASPTGWYTDRLLTTPATAIADSASFYLDSAQTFSDAPSAGSSLAVGLNADVTIGATTATLQDVTAGINATLAATGDVATTTLNALKGSDVTGFLPTTTLHLHDGAEYTVTQDSYTFPTLILDDSTTLTIPAGSTIKATTLTIGDDVTIASSARAYFVPPVALDMSGVNWVNAKRTVYFTNTDNSGAGSLRFATTMAQEGDFITPDPSVFHKGELVEITAETGIETNKGLTISAGETHLRLTRLNNSGDRILYAKSEAPYFHAEDVEFIGRIIGYTPETILTRCRIYGNRSDAPGITGHTGSKITVYDSLITGARGAGIYNAGANSATTVVRSTIAGNTQNLFSGSSTVVTKIDSIVDPVCSEAGFVVPPPDTVAVPETGVAIDWSAWDLHLVPTSPYATGATSASGTTDVEGTTRGVLDGGATRYAQGAYELTDSDVHIVTSNADSGNGSLRAILAEVKNDDSIYFALVNFPENQTTTITLNSELLVLGKDIEIIATENQDVVLSGNATVRPLTVCADYSYGAPRKSVTLRNLTITSGRANALTQSATTAISTLPFKPARKITRSQDCGGAIAVYGAGLTLDHCTITNSNATTSGGALYAAENAIVAATGTSFTSNVATTGDGGAVFITTDSSFVASEGTNFYTNQAQLEGSAIASDRSTVTCNNVVFSSNTAVEGNSIVYLTGVGTFDNCLFGETTATGQYTLYVADDSEATVGAVTKTATDPDLAFKVEDSTLNVSESDYAEVGLTVTLKDGTLAVQNTTAIPTLLFAAESDSTVVIADDETLTTETITADGTATFSAETQAFLSVLPTTELDNLTFNNVVVGRVGANVTEVTAVKVGENYTIKINSTVNTIPVVVEYKGENDSEWTVAAPSFVGTTFQIRVPGDNLTFRVYDGEKHVTATVRTYGLYPPMRERTEVGYVN